ncbi:MAG: efflux RND transporter periplasmic adaptor subunit [Spongiibacteraceae bacterium]
MCCRNFFIQLGLVLLLTVPSASVLADLSQPLSELVVHPHRSAPATAKSLNETVLSAQITASVNSIKTRVSQLHKKGDVLLNLDCRDYQLDRRLAAANYRAADARKKLAELELERARQLLDQEMTSQQVVDGKQVELDARHAELAAVDIAVRRADLNISRCTIRAPFNGIVSHRNIAVGQLATMGTPLLTIIDSERVEVSAQINPRSLPQISAAKQLWFNAHHKMPVKLQRSAALIDSQTRNQEIRLLFIDETPATGTAGKLEWLDPRPHVPAKYIISRNGQLGIFIVNGDKAKFHALDGAISGHPQIVDLPSGTLLITERLGTLKDGEAL